MSNSDRPDSKGRGYTLWVVAGLVLSLLVTAGFMINRQSVAANNIVVYKSPSCGCCTEWIKHLKEHGFSVTVHDQSNMNPIKADLGIPRHLHSCHTARVDGYLVEGHVPADLIHRMLEEKPKIKGLAVPGMPMGSPGMEGPRKDDYDVLTFDAQGKTRIYASR